MKKTVIRLSLLGLLLAFRFPVFGQNDIIWVPIAVHVLFDNHGKQFDYTKEITWETINSSLAYANRKFKGSNIQFFVYNNKIDSIKSTRLCNIEFYLEDTKDVSKNIQELTNLHKNFNALNIYIVPKHGNNQGGSTRLPRNDKIEDTYLILGSVSEQNMETFKNLMAHELGHSFFLLHTFESKANTLLLFQNNFGSKCERENDGICDTPVDPHIEGQKDLEYIVRNVLKNGRYGNNTPDLSNLMAYYYSVEAIKIKAQQQIRNIWIEYLKKDNFKFTSEQLRRVRKYAEKRKGQEKANFNYNPPLQPKPVISSLSLGTTKEIRWNDNSSTETGYFIERATNLDPQNFICVGGVGPNVSIYHDNVPLPSNVSTIKYRVIPSNAKGTSAYSTEMAINISPNVLFSIPDFVNNSLNQTNSPKIIYSIVNVCKNTSFPIEYYTEGAFAVNNQFKIQLSDQNGNFGANPLVIGTGTSSPINVTIPNQSFPNGNYRLRIVSTNPVTTSLASVDTYNIYPALTPPVITATPANVSYGSASILKATGCTGTVYWSFNKTGSSQVVKPTENTTYTAYCKTNCKSDEGTISVTVNNTAGISNINYMEYFFDNDPGFGNGVAVNITPGRLLETTIPVNTTGLSQGLHTLHVRVKTASNQWSTTHTQTVLVYGTGNNNRIVKVEYFYDTDPGFDNGTAVTVSPDSVVYLEGEFRTNNLSQGLHRLFVRAKDGYNRWSSTEQTPVLVIGTGSTIGLLSSAEYFIDTDPGVGNATSVSIPSQTEATFSFNVNLSNVSQGVHVVYVRVKDNLNRWSTHQSQVFVKIPNTLTRQITRAEYFIDTDPGQGNATAISYSPNPAQEMIANININANSLIKGEHTIYVRVKDTNNVWSVIASKLFEVESTPCPPVESLFLPSPTGLTQAMERIFSTSKIESNNKSTYQAGNSVLLSPGFETKSNVVFKVIISGCIND